jgi:hypothetical protein
MRLQSPDAFGQRSAALGRASAGGGAIGRLWRGLGRDRRLRRQHGLDRRIRPLELDREFGHFGGDVVDALAQQRVFHPLGGPRAFGLLLDRVDVALQLGAFVAGDASTAAFSVRSFSITGELPPLDSVAISSRNSFMLRSEASLFCFN